MKNIKKEIFDEQVRELSKKGGSGELLTRHKKILQLIYNNSSKDDYILDIGCFDGKILKTLEKKGYKNLFGVDFSDVSSKSFKDSNIHFAVYDIERDRLPFRRKFDIIIYTDVLEHVPSPQTTLIDIRNNLSKNGKIVFSVPNAGWFLNGFLLSFLPSKLFLSTAFGPWGHTYHFTFYKIKKIAKDLNFKLIELSGGKMKNYVFKTGIKKVFYDIFMMCLTFLSYISPQFFSDHIFGIFQNTSKKPNAGARFEINA